eukprot:425973-Amphidinium_carterae.1
MEAGISTNIVVISKAHQDNNIEFIKDFAETLQVYLIYIGTGSYDYSSDVSSDGDALAPAAEATSNAHHDDSS